ncbi:MAG: ribonuclease III [Clostridia bacterium]|nr:ribonuclease III [Clostridia bacterium]
MQNLRKERALLEEKIGYKFNDITLLETALTHSSYSNEAKSKGINIECNERLEFLGDSVLSIIASEYLYFEFDCPEGELTRMRAEIVCEKALAVFARKINLGEFLNLGHGEEMSGGRDRPSLLADAFESLLAAMFIDSQKNKDTVAKFLLPLLAEELAKLELTGAAKDFKTLLQQFVQQVGGEVLEYFVTKETGPDHDKNFTVEARLNSNVIGVGTGKSKRAAEQMAAKQALALFGQK